MIEIKDNFLTFEDEQIKKTKIYTGKFPSLIGKNSFQKKGDCILQMFGLLEPEPFNDYYRVRGLIGERIVEKYLKTKDSEFKYFGLDYNGFDLFKANNIFGGVLDFVLPKRSVNLEVKSTSISKRKDILANGGREEHIAQARLGTYLGNLNYCYLAYVFFTPREEELIKKGLGQDVIDNFDFDNIDIIKVDMNISTIQMQMREAYNYWKTCYNQKRIPLEDVSQDALEKLGIECNDMLFVRQTLC